MAKQTIDKNPKEITDILIGRGQRKKLLIKNKYHYILIIAKYLDKTKHVLLFFSSFFFLNSVLRPFQDYFSSYETGQSVGGRKRENPEKNHLAHPQAELGLSHM